MKLHLFSCEEETYVGETVEQVHAHFLETTGVDDWSIDDWVCHDDDEVITAGECDGDGKTTRTAAEWAEDFGRVGNIFTSYC
jgi:hypothetical protein